MQSWAAQLEFVPGEAYSFLPGLEQTQSLIIEFHHN